MSITRLGVAVVLAAFVVCPNVIAEAAELPLGCFERVYSANHLRQKPDQQVKRLRLKIGPRPDYDGRAFFSLRVWLRQHPQKWSAGGPCESMGNGWKCQPDTDGDPPIQIRWSGSAVQIDNPRLLTVFDDLTGPNLRTATLRSPGDASFLLEAAAVAICKKEWP